jgi:type VI secretion system protein ImpJ
VSALSLTIDRDIILELRRQIDCLVSALPPFEIALQSERAHPYSLYLALAALVGKLAALSRTPIPPVLPPYRHDELRSIFETARDHLFRMVDEGILESFTAHPFDFDTGRFLVPFHREWKGRSLILAAKARRGVAEDELLMWLQGSLIGASSKARAMQESRVLGMTRKRIERSGDLVATKGTFLFEMDEASPYLGLGEQLVVFNTADPSGAAGPVELVLYVKALG